MTPTPLIPCDPERVGGAPVFTGTRVPVATLDYQLMAGDPLDAFLRDFPSVEREHVATAMKLACEMPHA